MNHTKNVSLVPIITRVAYQFPVAFSLFELHTSPLFVITNFHHGHNWINLFFTPGNASFSETLKNPPGNLYNINLKLSFSGDESFKNTSELLLFHRLFTFPCIVKITFSNGLEKILGSPVNPSLVSFSRTSDINSTISSLEFSSTALNPALILFASGSPALPIIPPSE